MNDNKRLAALALPSIAMARLSFVWLRQRAFLLFIAALWLRMLIYLLAVAPDDPWLVGDWLINYRGGMVRRGLTGELLLNVSEWTRLAPARLVGIAQMACCTALLGGLYQLIRRLPVNPPTCLLLLSPAFLLIYVHNPHGGFRKEVLLLSLLAAWCARLAGDQRPVEARERLLLALALLLISLSHEMLFAYMPFFVIALRLARQPSVTTVPGDALILLPALLATLLIVLCHRGDAATAAAICASLGNAATQDCRDGSGATLGAIRFLGADFTAGRALVLFYTPAIASFCYLAAAVLALLPFAVILRFSNAGDSLRRRDPGQLALLLGLVLAQLAAVQYIAADHGRLIQIFITAMTLVLLQAMQAQGTALQFLPSRRRGQAMALSLLFVLGWKLKHVEMTPDKMLWWLGLLVAS